MDKIGQPNQYMHCMVALENEAERCTIDWTSLKGRVSERSLQVYVEVHRVWHIENIIQLSNRILLICLAFSLNDNILSTSASSKYD